MERKIGEIFEYNGEWYQCIVGNGCKNCAFYEIKCYNDNNDPIGDCCALRRKDQNEVIFKKLEKVGEPFFVNIQGNNVLQQRYKLYEPMVTLEGYWYRIDGNFINIEIKQTKEDMEEKKLNLKAFDLEAAKAGKPVCTRDGRKVRIICFDRIDARPILALVPSNDGKREAVLDYFVNGKRMANALESDLDLMMPFEKKEGWVNLYNADTTFYFVEGMVYDTKEEAIKHINSDNEIYTATTKINWEE